MTPNFTEEWAVFCDHLMDLGYVREELRDSGPTWEAVDPFFLSAMTRRVEVCEDEDHRQLILVCRLLAELMRDRAKARRIPMVEAMP